MSCTGSAGSSRTARQSLRALCQQPYLLEERLSRMVRAIQAEL
jgi:hypothetical protein